MSNYLGDNEKLVLAAILNLKNDAYGIEISETLLEKFEKKLSLPAIYTTLSRLEKKGFLSTRLGEVTAKRGGKAKLYFQVTGAGQRALKESQRVVMRIGSFALQ